MRTVLALSCLVLLSLYATSITTGMEIVSLHTRKLTDTSSTEEMAFECLRKNPLKHDIFFLAAPWQHLWKLSVSRSSRKRQKCAAILQDISKIKTNKRGFTVCYNFFKFAPTLVPLLQAVGVDWVFAADATKSKSTIDTLTILPFPYWSINGTADNHAKDILYSFVGSITHPLRQQLLHVLPTRHDAFVCIREKSWWLGGCDTTQYKDILARSRFSLCPRGLEPNSIRFYESLEAGAIPILLSDAAELPVLPAELSWEDCIIRVPEQDIALVPSMLAAISPAQEARLRLYGKQAYTYLSGENFTWVIRDFFDRLQ